MKMSKASLSIADDDGTWQAELKPNGTLIGRLPECDIVLNSSEVSRKHARIFRDPFGRWIIEDLGSQNGIHINNNRVETCAIIPGETIWLGSIALCIEQPLTQKVEQDESAVSASLTLDNSDAQVLVKRTRPPGDLSQHYLKHLNEINECFTKLTDISALYPAACTFMSQARNTVAVVLRVPANSELQSEAPEVLACRFGDDPDNVKDHDTTNLYLSQRVLESVRVSGRTVMAKSARSGEVDLLLTVQDVHNPRTVICAPLGLASDTVDLLYIDTPSEHTSSETFEFILAVAQQIALIRKNLFFMKAKSESEVINRQLSLAKEIQAKMIPGELKSRFAVDVAVSYEPAMWVGGDYYDVWSLENGQVAFTVGDVSGKGLPAAMIMTNLQAALRTTMNFCTELPSVLKHVNRHLCENLRDDMFVTLFLGVFDIEADTLTYINAGHLEPVIKGVSGTARFLDGARNIPLGILDQPFEVAVEIVPAETALLVVTDGVSETFAPGGEEYGTKRLVDLMDNADVQSAEGMVQLVSDEISLFRGSLARHDDTTIFALVNTEPS
jgi:phosphoserine phosphatase RsbU/P